MIAATDNTQPPLLDVQNLRVWFHTRNGVVKAVNDISFSVAAGETLAIVGESGSGKSVSCYSLLQLLPQPPAKIESGTALFAGDDLLAMNNKTLRNVRGNQIAMIFQDPMTCLNPYLSIGEQLMEPLRQHRKLSRSDAKSAALALLDEVGIVDASNRFDNYPHQFSGGMRQRVMIAMALITEPKLLICDEPTTALDVTVQKQILELIKSLQQRRNIAVIFISHDLAVVAGLADRVAVMQHGEIVESNTTTELFSNPQHPYTRKLLAAIPTGSKPTSGQLSEQQKPLIEVSNLRCWFTNSGSTTKAVDDVSLNIQRGEILGLVGESGSGKSTLGRAILRLTNITEGSVAFNDNEQTTLSNRQLRPLRPRMQMIFQDPYASLNPRMTIFETLAEPLLYHRLATRKTVTAQVLEIMDDVGLPHSAINKYPHEFSGGQRQRIAIGRAIATNPEFIVADEPVSALDVTIQQQILELMLQLTEQRNLTMLFISHDLSVVRYLCDRIVVMHRGKLIEEGAAEQIFQQPQQAYTQQLIAAVPEHVGG